MKIRLLALDMDGTAYYDGGDIVHANLQPIKDIMKQDVEVVFVTGRPIFARQNRFAHHQLIGPSTIVAGYNGAVIYHLNQHKVLHKDLISVEQAHTIFRLAQQLGTKETVVFGYVADFETVVMNRDHPEIRNPHNWHDSEMEFFDGRYETYRAQSNYEYFKFLIFAGNKKLFDQLKKRGFSIATGNNFNGEVNAPGVHKGSAIKWISNYYKIPREQMMAIGDGPNDLPMMPYVEHSVSLANSIKRLKQTTKHQIHLTNEEGGVSYAIKHLIWDKGTKK